MLLDHSETRLFSPGEIVLTKGERDRALYLLIAGWVKAPSGVVHPITTLGEDAFLDGTPRAVSVEAMSEGEMLRLSFEGFEALAARNPSLGRDILLDLGRILSARLRAIGEQTPGMDGLMAAAQITFPNYTQIPSRIPVKVWHAMRAGSLVAGLVVAALLIAVPGHGPVRDVEGHHPDTSVPVPHGPRPLAQPLPAGRLQSDTASAQAHESAHRAELAEGIRLRHRLQRVHPVRRPAPLRPRRQRRLLGAAAAGRDGRRVHRRHVLQGQERLVQHDVPAAAGPAHLRPDAAGDGRQRALPAVRRLRQELLRLQPARRLPGRPQRRRHRTGAATGATSSARSRASC